MSIAFDLWGQRGWPSAEVAGESHYAKSIRNLFGTNFTPPGAELTVVAQLVPEPNNRHDRNAVGAWVGNNQVGYLPREEAVRYSPVLSALVAEGWLPQVAARVWGGERFDYEQEKDTFRGSVSLDLAEPHMLVPSNMPPAGAYRLLPTGGAIQVTGEENHLDALAHLLRPEGECWAYASLHEVVEQLARTTRTVVEVRIDGAPVGQLTPKMSGEVLPAIRHLAEAGTVAACRAIVKGNRIKTEVVLYVARAHELPGSWLDGSRSDAHSTGTPVRFATEPTPSGSRSEPSPGTGYSPPAVHGPIPPRPTGIRFVVPPGWPVPPAGWEPPPGWRPEPNWPVAPEGWQWWVPIWG